MMNNRDSLKEDNPRALFGKLIAETVADHTLSEDEISLLNEFRELLDDEGACHFPPAS